MRKIDISRIAASGALLAVLAGCTLGPDYVRPAAPVATKYKEAEGWKPATPQEAASAEAWWSVFNDPVLDGLERQVEISNQTLKASEAAYRTAQAIVAEARAGYFPTLDLGGAATRSGNGAGSSSSSGRSSSSRASVQNSFGASASASWVPDIWGSIRRTVESDVANAQASAADLGGGALVRPGEPRGRLFRAPRRRRDQAPARCDGRCLYPFPADHAEPLWRRHRGAHRCRIGAPRSSRARGPRRSRPACSARNSSTRSPC